MNENYYNSRKIRPVNVSGDINKNGTIQPTNFSHNQINTRQTTNHNPSGNHLAQNILPQLVNLISPQIPVSQSGNQTLINMGFNATPFLQNQIYSIPNTFGALNTIASQSYGTNNVSYINNMRINHPQQSQAIMNFKENKVNHMASDINSRKLKNDGPLKNYQNPIKTSNYPVRLLINSELVGPLIGRKGEKIKEITANTGAKIDIKRESVPYSQFGLNNYMFSGCNRKGSGLTENDQIVAANNVSRGESQIVFIVSEPEKCSAAINEIMQLCTQEAKEQGREEPNMGLLAEDRFCARLIGKEGRFLNWVRCKSGSQVHVSNVPTITTLSEQPHVISLDRIISCRGGGLGSLLEAEKLISDKIRQCVAEDNAQRPCPRLAKDDSFLPPGAGDLSQIWIDIGDGQTQEMCDNLLAKLDPHLSVSEVVVDYIYGVLDQRLDGTSVAVRCKILDVCDNYIKIHLIDKGPIKNVRLDDIFNLTAEIVALPQQVLISNPHKTQLMDPSRTLIIYKNFKIKRFHCAELAQFLKCRSPQY